MVVYVSVRPSNMSVTFKSPSYKTHICPLREYFSIFEYIWAYIMIIHVCA
jgi:hypothetical protein